MKCTFLASHLVAVTSALVLGTACSEAVLAQTPVAHWTFNDGLNNYLDIDVDDISGGESTATWELPDASGLAYTGGIIGGAVKLAGGADNFFSIVSIPEIDNTVAIPDPPTFPQMGVGITWSGWINTVGIGSSYQGLLMSYEVTDRVLSDPNTAAPGKLYGLGYESASTAPHIDSRVSTGAVDSVDNDITAGAWHHVAMVWGNDTVSPVFPAHRVYVDGQLAAEDPDDTDVIEFITSGTWRIGSDPSGVNGQYIGLLDDFAVFDQALTATQIQTVYTNGLNGIDASGNNTADVVPGDVDGNGSPGIEDFNLIRDHLGQNVTGRNLGDLDGNRKVDLTDYRIWFDLAPLSAQKAALGQVPEPTAMLFFVQILLCGMCSRRVRRFSRR